MMPKEKRGIAQQDYIALFRECDRLTAENEALRAKCAEMGRALEGCIEELVCFHPKMNAEEPCATYGTWLRAKESLEDNPGQALLKYVKALERVPKYVMDHNDVLQNSPGHFSELTTLAREALAACKKKP